MSIKAICNILLQCYFRLRRKGSEYSKSRGDLSSTSNSTDDNNREKLRQMLCNLRKDPMDEDLVIWFKVLSSI